MSASAIAELRAAFDEPFWDLGRAAARDRETVLLSWPSVPVELVRAAGFAPVFARGAGAPTPAADRVLEAGLFPSRLRQLVEAALSGRLADVAAIVLPRSSDPDYKCFLYLRELTRRGIAPALPPVLLFDLLHSNGADVSAYNAGRARDLSARLANLAGRPHREDELRAAIVSANRARAAARRLHSMRSESPRIAGADALPLLGAFWQLAPERYAALANAIADSLAGQAPLERRRRVLVAGVPVDTPVLHAAIEAEGAVVVAELSPFGGCGTRADVEIADDPFSALANHYGRESIDARLPVNVLMHTLDNLLCAVETVVVSQPPDDASFGWDYPRVRELLARRSLAHAVLGGDPALGATAADRARIRSLLGSVGTRPESRCG
jgi:benzoyl-CoA reductase/2-hydroxyglutaryl-CoA dehydratase subunit BcrC/BadD/HgdB